VSEPEFIAQTAEPMDKEEVKVWIQVQVEAGKAQGATFFRATCHPNFPEILLVEGWSKRPNDQGEPRFQMVATPKQIDTNEDN